MLLSLIRRKNILPAVFFVNPVWGNPYLRILRQQLEEYISDRLGKEYLDKVKNEVEFKIVKNEISELKNKLMVL